MHCDMNEPAVFLKLLLIENDPLQNGCLIAEGQGNSGRTEEGGHD